MTSLAQVCRARKRFVAWMQRRARNYGSTSTDCTYDISYSSGPRCTPIVSDKKIFSLGAMGDLLCLDSEKGTVLWSHSFPKRVWTEKSGVGLVCFATSGWRQAHLYCRRQKQRRCRLSQGYWQGTLAGTQCR